MDTQIIENFQLSRYENKGMSVHLCSMPMMLNPVRLIAARALNLLNTSP